MLDGIRVLEDSCEATMYAAMLLAELGADVVVMEPPKGSEGRRRGPFVNEKPGLESGIPWQSLNCAKRGISLDVSCSDGGAIFEELVERFDVLLTARGSQTDGRDDLRLPERVVRCRVTPFLGDGPKTAYQATDLTVMAASGPPGITGDRDRPPVFFPVPQAMMEAGTEAAIGTVVAALACRRDGTGQAVDVSARVAAMAGGFEVPLYTLNGDIAPEREERRTWFSVGDLEMPRIYQCLDGFCEITCIFGSATFSPKIAALASCLVAEGYADQRLLEVDWTSFKSDGDAGIEPLEPLETLIEATRRFCGDRTKFAVAENVDKYGFLAAPIFDMADVAGFEQFRVRGMWVDIGPGSEGEPVEVPARFAQFSNYRIATGPAPRLSEHTSTVLGEELGLSLHEVQALFVHGIV